MPSIDEKTTATVIFQSCPFSKLSSRSSFDFVRPPSERYHDLCRQVNALLTRRSSQAM